MRLESARVSLADSTRSTLRMVGHLLENYCILYCLKDPISKCVFFCTKILNSEGSQEIYSVLTE